MIEIDYQFACTVETAVLQFALIVFTIDCAVIFSFYGIKHILGGLRKKIKSFIEKEFHASDEIKKGDKSKALKQANLIGKREEKLNWLVRTMSLIEMATFGVLTVLISLDKSSHSFLDAAKILGAFLGGWLGIKVLSSHSAWSDPVVGKAYYHISLFGTLLNVVTGVIAGLVIYFFWNVFEIYPDLILCKAPIL